ncbi:hypothetical protein J6590_050705 [Homalodisca vitripennis]|nr:hypothetical protein J6590_050705 [Homalodisca vitripennis]
MKRGWLLGYYITLTTPPTTTTSTHQPSTTLTSPASPTSDNSFGLNHLHPADRNIRTPGSFKYQTDWSMLTCLFYNHNILGR